MRMPCSRLPETMLVSEAHVVTWTMVMSGMGYCQSPCFGLWSCWCWGLCWCSWATLRQGTKLIMLVETWRPCWLISASTEIHILVLRLVHPNIYHIYDLLECTKRLILCNDSQKISLTLSNNRISRKSFSESPVMMVCQEARKPWPD